MMVDGSRGAIPPPPHQDPNNQLQESQETKPKEIDTGADSLSVAPSTSAGPVVAEETSVTTSSRSRWMKLRTTVQLSSAITQVNKKPPLKREDSFLKRFSTRPLPDPNVMEGSSRLAGDGMVKSPFLGVWRSVVNPDENILFYWLSLLTVCLLYNAWTIIVRQAFPELQGGWSTLWYCLDGFTDMVFTLDIAFQFRTGYLEQGLMVCESKKLAGHYIKSKSFLLDILAIIPLDLFQFHFGVMPILRFPRFLKLYRSFRLYYMVESRTIYPNLWRVVNLIHILLLLAHWFGCFYYLLSELEGFVGEWSYRKPIDDYATLSRKYLGSVYWSTLTLTTIGDLATPATNLQYMFTIISYLIGVFIFATIVGQVGTVITNRNASRLEFERLLDGAKLYMRHHKVPRNMQRRVQRWYDYSWSRGRMQGGGDINSALGILPDKLKTELALHVNLKTLKKVSIFQECQPEFLHDLVLKMRAYIFTPGDLICRKGEVAREMFIIADGILEVISETGRVLTQMKAGDFFGEIGILNLDGFNRRTADVRSVGYSELFSLSREDILAAMKDYPEAQDILQTMGRKRLMEARLAANIGRASGGANESKLPSSVQVQTDGERHDGSKARSTVSKLKEDVRSLTKLLRTRSTTTGNASDSGETIELKPLNSGDEAQTPKGDVTSARRRNVSFKTMIQKIQFKREDSMSSVKSFTERLSSFRTRADKSFVESSSISTEDSADSTTPLNKSLPLLQRVRLLGAQEKKSDLATNVSLPKDHKSGLLKFIQKSEENENKIKTSPKSDTERLGKRDSPPPSPKSKGGPFSAMLTSVIPKCSTSPKSPKRHLPKVETSPEGKKSPVMLKGRLPEVPSEIPLLKKVLLRKVMDDKKTDTTPTENQASGSPVAQDQGSSHDLNEDTDFSDAFKNENNEPSQETVSNRVYLEQFSRTLGFQMSEDVVASKATSRPRLNASSLTPSPSSENVNSSALEESEKTQEKEETKVKSTSPPKGRLSRMMAVREDSDENSVMTEDPFVKSTECQTELTGTAFDTKTFPEFVKSVSEVDIFLHNYLTKVITDLETVIKAYSLEQQQDLVKENAILKQDQDNKDIFIKKLLSRIEEIQPWETNDEVSSLGASSVSVSDILKDNHTIRKQSNPDYDESNPLDDEDRDLEDEEVLALQEKLKHQRKSWPTSVSIRRKLEPTRQSCSLDDETQDPDVSNQDELWRLEFPPPPPELKDTPWAAASKPIYPTVPESLIDEIVPPEEEQVKTNTDATPKGANDWEVQMLVEQFEENVVHQKGRRHSSGEALTWDKVLHMRNTIRSKRQNSEMRGIRAGRKFSLVEESTARAIGSTQQWGAAGSSAIAQSTSYTSLLNLERYRNSATGRNDRTDSASGIPKNCGSQHIPAPSARRKNSLPILSQTEGISISRWLSMEDVQSEGNRSRMPSLQPSMSSGCSEETVVEMNSNFTSVDYIPSSDRTRLRTRSPSSPNVATDRESQLSLDFSSTSRLPDWTSTPCLPVIREDEQFTGSATTPPNPSPGRSISHDLLPKPVVVPMMQPIYETGIHSQGNTDSFQTSDPFYDTNDQDLAVRDSVILSIDRRTQHYQEVSSDNQYYPNTRAPGHPSTTPLKDNPRSLSQNSVVISIPECENVLSP